MIAIGGRRPAGWIYVASHPDSVGFTKVGYSKWHPRLPCIGYPKGFKRLHQIERYIVAFGLKPLNDWVSDYHERAERVEQAVHRELKVKRRLGVGPATDIFDIEHDAAVEIVKRHLHA